jgi:hypothetical protein
MLDYTQVGDESAPAPSRLKGCPELEVETKHIIIGDEAVRGGSVKK